MRFRLFTAAALLSASLALHADTLASVAPDAGGNISAAYIGQSFTVQGSGTFQDIAFSFYSPALQPFATGTGYLFAQPFVGTGPGLNALTAGYLASAPASGGAYSFASIVLTAGVQYFFYEDSLIPASTLGGNNSGIYTGGALYTASLLNSLFSADPSTQSAFLVTGTPITASTVTPEPSSFLLLGTGLLGAAGALKRRSS